MRGNGLTGSVDDQRIHNVENSEFDETESLQHEAAADYFERRSRMWIRLGQGDVWIAIGIYLILASIAIAVL
jgi:hypothetical protein